jgi:hypothetical protein
MAMRLRTMRLREQCIVVTTFCADWHGCCTTAERELKEKVGVEWAVNMMN